MSDGSTNRRVVSRWTVLALNAAFWGAGAVFMVWLASTGSGDTWIGYVMAAVCVGIVWVMWARVSISVSTGGVRSGFWWGKRVTLDELAELSYSAPGELAAVQRDGTRRRLAVVPSFFWDSEDRVDRAESDFLNRAVEAVSEFGWRSDEGAR